MTTYRLGRWSFFAGAVFALVWSTLAQLTHSPWWLNALTAFVGSWLAYRVIERIADRIDTAGRCGVGAPMLTFSTLPRPVCALSAGHAGWHRSDDGCEWGQIREDQP